MWNRRLPALLAAGAAALLVALAIGWITRPADPPTPDTIWLQPGADAPGPTDRDGIEVVPPPVRLDSTTAPPVTAPPATASPPPPSPAPPAPTPPASAPGDDDDGGFEPDEDDGFEPHDDGDDDDGNNG